MAQEEQWARWRRNPGRKIIVAAYAAVLVFFLLGELGLHGYRATNQVILIVVLLFVPFLISFAPAVVERLRITTPRGDVVEVQLQQLQDRVEEVNVQLERIRDESGRITTAEQVLLPLLGGPDGRSAARIEQRRLIIGSKEWPEQWLAAELVAQQIERCGSPRVRCERRFQNGGTLKNFADLTRGWIDGYVEYTGTGCTLLSVDYTGGSTEEILSDLNARSEPHGIVWLPPLGIRTNYVMVMKEDVAQRLRITNLEELAPRAGRLRFCSHLEFLSRPDAFPGLRRRYGLYFQEVKICALDDRYAFLREDKADLCVGHETDAELREEGFRILADTRKFFPDYYAVPLFRKAVLESLPDVRVAVTELRHKLDNDRMIQMIAALREISRVERAPEKASTGVVRDLLDELE